MVSSEVKINPIWQVENIPQLDGFPETTEYSADAEEFPEFSDETFVNPVDNDEASEKALGNWRDFQSLCQATMKKNKNEVMKTQNKWDFKTNNLFVNPGHSPKRYTILNFNKICALNKTIIIKRQFSVLLLADSISTALKKCGRQLCRSHYKWLVNRNGLMYIHRGQ